MGHTTSCKYPFCWGLLRSLLALMQEGFIDVVIQRGGGSRIWFVSCGMVWGIGKF